MAELLNIVLDHWLLAILLVAAVYKLAEALYNVYFHPLANVPGPFWCKISGWPSCYQASTGSRHIWIWQNHQIYGDRFRYRPNGVLIASPKGYHDIYNAKANVKKAKWYEVWRKNDKDFNALNTVDPHKHTAMRKPLNSAFSDKSLRSAEPFITKNVDRWIEVLLDGEKRTDTTEWSTPKNLGGEWVDYLIFDILGDLCFGRSFETIEPGDNPLRQIPHIIGGYLQFMYPIVNSPFLDTWVWLKPRGLDKLMAMIIPKPVKGFNQFLETCISERKKQEQTQEKTTEKNERKDMFHYLYHAKDAKTGGPAFNEAELASTLGLLVTAGSDTTATALCSAFFHLTRNTYVYEKLAREIRGTFSSVEDIRSGPTLSNCQYLQACCLESMRMAPSGPSEFLREVLPGGHKVDGIWYPANTLIGVPNYSVNHHQDTYQDPFVFRPERWIVNLEQGISLESVAALKDAFKPFSIGPAQCPGKNIAQLEMWIVLARLIYTCDFRRSSGDLGNRGAGRAECFWGRRDGNQYQVVDAFLALRDGPVIEVRRRAKA